MANEAVGERAARAAAPWVERLARYGYAAKGVVYVVVGLLAMQAALGSGGDPTDTEGALGAIFRQPFGAILLLVVGVGLLSYVAWRLVQGLLDVEGKGRDLKGIVKRVGYVASGVAYGSLAISALRQSVGVAASGGRSQEDWTALVLSHPAGRWLVLAAAAVAAGLAVNAVIVAVRRLFSRKLKQEEMSETMWRWAAALAQAGLLARGLVFGLVAAFFAQAGLESDPKEAGGLSEVLLAIARQPQGPWLLGAMALGLTAYGVFAGVQARYRRIRL